MADVLSNLDRVFSRGQVASEGRAGVDEKFAAEYPVLYDLLTATPTLNGKTRQVGTVTVVAEDGVFKAGLRDRDHNMSLWVSTDALGDLWAALEAALNQSPVPWRRVDTSYRNTKRS